MKIIRGLHNAAAHGGCVLTIGNFDGVHRGHQALLVQLAQLARRHAVPATLLTFEPHPVEVLAPQRAPARLTRFREKIAALAAHPVERVVCARFHRGLAAMTPQRFIGEVLRDRLGVRHLLIGDDFRFGHGGSGTFETLREAAAAGVFELTRVDTVRQAGERVSSTRVRTLLQRGALDEASALLGREYAVCGRVMHGQRLGRTIGFPTANVALRRLVSPLSGVFAVTLRDRSGRLLRGVANVGHRPTVGGTEARVEVHVFDFDGDLYGLDVQVGFLRRLRPEQRFDGLDALRRQIALDVDAARAVHAAAHGGAAAGHHG